MADQTYRLITRPDFDGIVCGTLMLEQGMIDDVVFAQPVELQHGRLAVSDRDITTNLPYVPGVHLCFDHHWSELERVGRHPNLIIDPNAPSAARVVYDYYGGEQRFPAISADLMEAVDKADAAQFTEAEVLAPEGWTLLNFVLDGRTGLADRPEFSITGEQLMRDLMTYCRHNPIDEILALPDIQERINAYWYYKEFAEAQIGRCSRVVGKTVVCDLRGEESVFPGDRFLIYALYPDCEMSLTLRPSDDPGRVEIAGGKSIFRRTSAANIGSIMLRHGGGGHAAAGTCRVPDADADAVLEAVLQRIAEAELAA